MEYKPSRSSMSSKFILILWEGDGLRFGEESLMQRTRRDFRSDGTAKGQMQTNNSHTHPKTSSNLANPIHSTSKRVTSQRDPHFSEPYHVVHRARFRNILSTLLDVPVMTFRRPISRLRNTFLCSFPESVSPGLPNTPPYPYLCSDYSSLSRYTALLTL